MSGANHQPKHPSAEASLWTAMAKRSGDTSFERTTAVLRAFGFRADKKRRGALLPAAVQIAQFVLLLSSFSGLANNSVHLAYHWHLHQPIYWPERNPNGNQTNRYQFAADSMNLKFPNAGNFYSGSTFKHPRNALASGDGGEFDSVFDKPDRVIAYQGGGRDSINTILSHTDGGALVSQAPAGNGGNIETNEFLLIPTAALNDVNADGKFDRVDPLLGFKLLSISASGGNLSVRWAVMPYRTYQVEFASTLPAAWSNLLGSLTTAGALQLELTNVSEGNTNPLARFFRVKLLP